MYTGRGGRKILKFFNKVIRKKKNLNYNDEFGFMFNFPPFSHFCISRCNAPGEISQPAQSTGRIEFSQLVHMPRKPDGFASCECSHFQCEVAAYMCEANNGMRISTDCEPNSLLTTYSGRIAFVCHSANCCADVRQFTLC